MKHTDLTDKEVAGVIDHADNSITAAKIAPNQNLSTKGFNAAWVRNVYLEHIRTFTWGSHIHPDEIIVDPIELTPGIYFFAIDPYLDYPFVTGGMIVTGLTRTIDGKPHLAIKNIGTQDFTYFKIAIFQLRIKTT